MSDTDTDDYETTPETRSAMARAFARQIAADPVALRTLIRAIANDTDEAAYLGRRIAQAQRDVAREE